VFNLSAFSGAFTSKLTVDVPHRTIIGIITPYGRMFWKILTRLHCAFWLGAICRQKYKLAFWMVGVKDASPN